MSSFASNTLTGVIASGAALSSSINIGDDAAVAVSVPASVAISFQGSMDNQTFYDIYKDDGTEYTFTAVSGVLHTINLNQFLAPRYVKIRTGTSGSPSNRVASTTVTLVTKEI